MSSVLGEGAYGLVTKRNGRAVKKFKRINSLVQEYIASKYLRSCEFIVDAYDANYKDLEMEMELFDGSLRDYLNDHGFHYDTRMLILKHILYALIDIHGRGVVHGDLKCGNILVNTKPMRVVLGDLGFVSVSKFAKCERTAAIYRDPVVIRAPSHDIFSFGIIFIEMIGRAGIKKQYSYEELQNMAANKLTGHTQRDAILACVHAKHDKRPTASYLLKHLFHEDRVYTKVPYDLTMDFKVCEKEQLEIRRVIQKTAEDYKISRSRIGYIVVLYCLTVYQPSSDTHMLWIGTVLLVLSAIFGKSGFREEAVISFCEHRFSKKDIYNTLDKICQNTAVVDMLMESNTSNTEPSYQSHKSHKTHKSHKSNKKN